MYIMYIFYVYLLLRILPFVFSRAFIDCCSAIISTRKQELMQSVHIHVHLSPPQRLAALKCTTLILLLNTASHSLADTYRFIAFDLGLIFCSTRRGLATSIALVFATQTITITLLFLFFAVAIVCTTTVGN